MPAWTDLVQQFSQLQDQDKPSWVENSLQQSLHSISKSRGDRNVLFYATAFLQKPQLPSFMTSLTYEEINGIMSCLFGMDWEKGLTLILHTPGGMTNAAETVVQYLQSKFPYLEVIVPTFAMSAGTMISLSSNRIVMGRQSQLGPIDPQMGMGGQYVSARAIVDQFDRARADIFADPKAAHAWAPILASLGPSLLVEAQNALDYGERMVAEWLAKGMLSGHPDPTGEAKKVAHYFNDAGTHKSHGRRIGRDEAKSQGLVIEDLENDQQLQDHVLTAYHLLTIMFENSPACKVLVSNHGQTWIKNA